MAPHFVAMLLVATGAVEAARQRPLVPDRRSKVVELDAGAVDKVNVTAEDDNGANQVAKQASDNYYELLGNGRCRTESGGKGSYSKPKATCNAECAQACSDTSDCVAYEWSESNQHCEAHRETITSVAGDSPDLYCYIKLTDDSSYAVAVKSAAIGNGQQLILYKGPAQRNNMWKLEADGRIVLTNDPSFSVAVQYAYYANGMQLILHDAPAQGNNRWKLEADGRIVLTNYPCFSVAVQSATIGNGQQLILHDGPPQRNNRWKLEADGRIVLA